MKQPDLKHKDRKVLSSAIEEINKISYEMEEIDSIPDYKKSS
jgi:hypothetical protein